MAEEAISLKGMPLADRVVWAQEQLCRQPGKVVRIEGQDWWELDSTGSLPKLIVDLTGGGTPLTMATAVNKQLSDAGRRTSAAAPKGSGSGSSTHRILIPEGMTPDPLPAGTGLAAAVATGVLPAADPLIVSASAMPPTEADDLLRQALAQLEEVARLREELTLRQKVNDELRQENDDLRRENDELRAHPRVDSNLLLQVAEAVKAAGEVLNQQ